MRLSLSWCSERSNIVISIKIENSNARVHKGLISLECIRLIWNDYKSSSACCWHPRRPKSAAIPKPHDLSFCFNHRCIPRLKNHVLSYTKSTDFRDLSEARFRVSHGTVLTKRFLYLLRATFYPDKLFWTEPPKPSFQGAVRPLGFRDGLFNSNVKPT